MPTLINVGLRCAALTALLAFVFGAPRRLPPDRRSWSSSSSRPTARPGVASGDGFVRDTAGKVAVVDPGPGESVADALAAYRARPDVAYPEPNRVRHLFALGTPDDPDYSQQWALSTIDALGGWSPFPGAFTPAAGIPIGIVDTGVDGSHGDLSGSISADSAVCLSGGCTAGAPTDPVGHGTHVAGIAGAATAPATRSAIAASTGPRWPLRSCPGLPR